MGCERTLDTYDRAANFASGLAAAALGRSDARDGFEVASQSIEYRSAAWHALALHEAGRTEDARRAFDRWRTATAGERLRR